MKESMQFRSRRPTVIALQRAIARGEIPPTTNVEMALHLIQGPLISKRIVDDSALTEAEFDSLLDMTCRALADSPVEPRRSPAGSVPRSPIIGRRTAG